MVGSRDALRGRGKCFRRRKAARSGLSGGAAARLGWWGCSAGQNEDGYAATIMRCFKVSARHLLLLLAASMLLALPASGDTTYRVRSGDSIWSIAKQHGLCYLVLLHANNLDTDSRIRPGQRIVIPGPSPASGLDATVKGASGDDASPGDAERATVVHIVRRGESLWALARRYHTSVSAIAAANGIDPRRIVRVGARLTIPARSGVPKEQPRAEASQPRTVEQQTRRTHIVRSGESLWTISRKYGTTVGTLAAANGLRPENLLRVNRQLAIPSQTEPLGSASSAPEGASKSVYVVRKGDSLWTIARRHGTTVRALAQGNGLREDRVLPVGIALAVPAPAGGGKAGSSTEYGQQRFVQTALLYQGIRYRWGGMSNRGMDCSGLVARVLRSHGIDAPHNSKALYRLGKAVNRKDLQPGDLVFFHTTRPGISHVGIYIGDGQFIHASSGKGRVRIDRLDQGYYDRRLVGAKRVS